MMPFIIAIIPILNNLSDKQLSRDSGVFNEARSAVFNERRASAAFETSRDSGVFNERCAAPRFKRAAQRR
jgi:hypothetical protein